MNNHLLLDFFQLAMKYFIFHWILTIKAMMIHFLKNLMLIPKALKTIFILLKFIKLKKIKINFVQ